MKRTRILLFLILVCSNLNSYGQQKVGVPKTEIREIIELAIELPELQQHFHISEDPTRVPLVIKESGSVNADNLQGVMKFGEQIQVLNEKEISEKEIKAYLTIGDWTYGGDNLRLQMEYPIERILINIRFNRINGQWKIVDFVIFEE